MTLKQHEGTLIVKRLVEGGPAAESGQIELGDVLLKVCVYAHLSATACFFPYIYCVHIVGIQ